MRVPGDRPSVHHQNQVRAVSLNREQERGRGAAYSLGQVDVASLSDTLHPGLSRYEGVVAVSKSSLSRSYTRVKGNLLSEELKLRASKHLSGRSFVTGPRPCF